MICHEQIKRTVVRLVTGDKRKGSDTLELKSKERFVFEMTGLRLEVDRLTFYIRPEDGLGLPDILKWIKQTFAVRYNKLTGRRGISGGSGIGR
jgi:hypothetical protein